MNGNDFDPLVVLRGKFTTYNPSTGAPFTLAGSPVVSVYKDDSTAKTTAGVTLTPNFDGLAGCNHIVIDTSADTAFYSAGSFFEMVITTGTVNSVSAIGTVVGRFMLRKNSALKPTTAGRTLDVTPTGEAGIDWGNVGNPTTPLALSGTTVSPTQVVDSVTNRVTANTDQWNNVAVTGMPMPTYSQPTGFLATVFPAAVSSLTAANVRTELSTELERLDVAVSSRMATFVYTTPPTAAANAAAVRFELTTELVMIDVPVSSRLASGSYVAPLSAAGTRAAIGLAAANLDTQLAALPLASVWTTTRAGYLDQVLLAENPAKRTVKVTGGGSGHVAADVHETQPGSIHPTTFQAGAIDAVALASSASSEIATAVRTEVSVELAAIMSLVAKFTGMTTIAGWLRTLMRKTAGDSVALGEINTGGTGVFVPSTMALENLPSISGGGSGADPLLNPVPGTYAVGTAGYNLGKLTTLGTATVVVVSPISTTGKITLVSGDDYKAANNRALSFTNAAGTWPNLTGAVISFTTYRNETIVIGPVTGGITTAVGPNQQVTIELTRTQTEMGAYVGPSWFYSYVVIATLSDGNVVTLAQGALGFIR
jgi:hypothetical protein